MYMYMFVYMYTYIYICMYVYIYMYRQTYEHMLAPSGRATEGSDECDAEGALAGHLCPRLRSDSKALGV